MLGLVTVSGRDGAETVVAKADTGAKRTSIGIDLAASIGAGPVTGTTAVRSSVSNEPRKRPMLDIHIGLSGQWTTVTASMDDREGMDYPMLIGRDILNDYQVDVGRRVDEE